MFIPNIIQANSLVKSQLTSYSNPKFHCSMWILLLQDLFEKKDCLFLIRYIYESFTKWKMLTTVKH
jgi:hypothetical protein